MDDINKFYDSLIQEVQTIQQSNEDGDTQEQVFTRIAVDLLAEAGEVENAEIAFDEKEIGKKGQHKINGYAIADNYETVDLFISIFELEDNIKVIHKADIDRAATRITNFFRKATYDDYSEEVAESSPIFEFAHTLANYDELRNNLVRVNAYILTDGSYKGDIPKDKDISGYKIFYRVIDINYLYTLSEDSRLPISFDFDEEKCKVPCVTIKTKNTDYNAYIAILPGKFLASIYERYGSRLLEQNVRSFLQFTGKINKGIKTTIKEEPHMFLAYNNGIAATADNIELDESGHFIKTISNLQIVNGGQTTASIYYTSKKDKADISDIYVQAKISVIHQKEQYAEVVSRISRYANTQNKVDEADFTSNNPSLIEFERMSRFVMCPISEDRNYHTYWFFERARGQYKTLRQKEGFTKSRQNAFDLKYPKSQMFNKVELAKYENSYREIYEGKKLVVGPHIVVRGNQKNYSRYISDCLPDNINKITNIYFEDAVAKAILFKTLDKLYGTKRSINNIGELKQVVVPYTMSLLYILTDGELDLYKIWKQQHISEELANALYKLMVKVNEFVIKTSPGTHYIEWAKKEDCWNKVKEHDWNFDINLIKDDLIDYENMPVRHVVKAVNDEDATLKHDEALIRAIPYKLWEKIADWLQESEYLNLRYQTAARDIAHSVKFNKKFTENMRNRAMTIYETVCQYNYDLLEEADEISEQDNKINENVTFEVSSAKDINLGILKEMLQWEYKHHVLENWKVKIIEDVLSGIKPLTQRRKYGLFISLEDLRKNGFNL